MASSRLASRSVPLSKPITGIAVCCARAASGHATAVPSAASNSRRPMVTVMRPSRARVRRKDNDNTPPACSLQVKGGKDGWWTWLVDAGGTFEDPIRRSFVHLFGSGVFERTPAMKFVMILGGVLAVFWFDAAVAQEGYFGHDHDKWHH